MKITIIIGVLAALPASAALTGTVLDSALGTPLAEVSVTLEGHAAKSVTGADGRFRLEPPTALGPAGRRPAILSAPGEDARRDARGRVLGLGASAGSGNPRPWTPAFAAGFQSAEVDPGSAIPLAKVSAAYTVLFSKTGYATLRLVLEDGVDRTVRLVAGPRPDDSLDAGCVGLPAGAFCDDFRGSAPDTSKWWYGRKHWGPKPPRNHGVIPENVEVRQGRAWFAANGDRYSGPLRGVAKSGAGYVQDRPGTRTGGVLVTDAYFGSGRYEARMRLPRKTGVCVALWTLHYQEIQEGEPGYAEWLRLGNRVQGSAEDGRYVVVNHEIDIETPTAREGEPDSKASWRMARFNSWIGETGAEFTDYFDDLGADMSDGQFHVYRFDWHTDPSGAGPRVDFFIDGTFKRSITTHVPFIKGRFWIGTWFPEWAGGVADFDVQHLEVDWVRIILFHEAGDRTLPETYPDEGLTKCGEGAANEAGLPRCRMPRVP